MHEVVERVPSRRQVRVERGIYRQANGKYAVCFMLDGKPRFRTVGNDLELARAQRLSFATPLSQRNVQRSALHYAADAAGLRVDGARLRFHDLRRTFASHLIIDLGLDVVQVSRILGHACPSTTLDIYAHMFDEARHAADVRSRMAGSAFAGLLENDEDEGTVITLPAVAGATSGPLSARQRAAIKWAT